MIALRQMNVLAAAAADVPLLCDAGIHLKLSPLNVVSTNCMLVVIL